MGGGRVRGAVGRRVLLGAVVAVAVGFTVWTLWPSARPAPRARSYLAFTACLLTDAQGVTGAAARPVWAGMQDASLATRAKVQYLPAMAATRTADVLPYLASLVQRHCDVVVTVGPAQVDAVTTVAGRYPDVRFVVVGRAPAGPNVTVIDTASAQQVRDRVSALIRAAVKS
jgi:basic membrane lipoprotein Med (substrate-binding protein (PBP1-ABC) superfamily)